MLLPMYKLAHLPLPYRQDPHNLLLSLMRRCATDVSIMSDPLDQIFLKCIYIIYPFIQSLFYTLMLTYPAGGLNFGIVYLQLYFVCASS